MKWPFPLIDIFYFLLLQLKLGDHSEDAWNMHGVSGKNGQVIEMSETRYKAKKTLLKAIADNLFWGAPV